MIRRLGVAIGFIILILMYILPFVWMIAVSLKTNNEMFESAGLIQSLIPKTFQWENYLEIFNLIPFGRYLVNSLGVAVLSAFLETGLAAMAAYGLSILKRKWMNRIHGFLFFAWMIPFSVVLVPRFFLMVWLPDLMGGSDLWSAYRVIPFGGENISVGRLLGLDSFFGLIVPGSVSITAVFLLVTSLERISPQTLDCAYLDSGSAWRVFTDMVLPLMIPSIVTIAFLAFLSSWQSFTWPLLVTSSLDMQTATVGLRAFQTLHSTQWPLLMASSVILTLPSLGFLLLAQTYVIDRYKITELYHHRM